MAIVTLLTKKKIGRNSPGVSHKRVTRYCIKGNIVHNILEQEPIISRIGFILVANITQSELGRYESPRANV